MSDHDLLTAVRVIEALASPGAEAVIVIRPREALP